jgi:hypothetical protein
MLPPRQPLQEPALVLALDFAFFGELWKVALTRAAS